MLHDSSFYGAQIKMTPEKTEPPGNGGGKLLTQGGTALVPAEREEEVIHGADQRLHLHHHLPKSE